MFVSMATARRIEHAEAEMTRATVAAIGALGRAADAFVRALGGGVAAFVRAGSPMNKVIGAGVDAPLDAGTLAALEEALRAHGEPARVELATLAVPETGAALTARGYRLAGFENVLVRSLAEAPMAQDATVRVERMTAATKAAWADTIVDGFAHGDDSGAVVDAYSRDAIASVMEDVLQATSYERYLAYVGGVLAGAASMRVHDGIATMSGSATLPAQRRRGAQTALIATRLAEARARGAELAVITTAPGSQSQANVMRHGFALAYARAILVRADAR